MSSVFRYVLRGIVGLILLLAGVWLFSNHPGLVIVGLLFWVLPVIVGYRLTVSKDSPWPLGLSLLLSWVGVLIGLALPAPRAPVDG